MAWTYRPDLLAAALEAAGFDVDRSAAETIGGGSLVGRRERADRAVLVAVDAAGRVRIEITRRLDETAGSETLGGVAFRTIEERTRRRTLTGRLAEPEDLARVLDALDPKGARRHAEAAPGARPGPPAPEDSEQSAGPEQPEESGDDPW